MRLQLSSVRSLQAAPRVLATAHPEFPAAAPTFHHHHQGPDDFCASRAAKPSLCHGSCHPVNHSTRSCQRFRSHHLLHFLAIAFPVSR